LSRGQGADQTRDDQGGGGSRDTAERPSPVSSIPAKFSRAAARHPEGEAARWGEESLSYRELDALSNRVARRLVAAGAKPGEAVPLVLSRSPRSLAAVLGVLKAGAAYAFLDPREPALRRDALLSDLSARFVLTDSTLADAAAPAALPRVLLDDPAVDSLPSAPLGVEVSPESPACVMYTSGSTGVPKGVVVPHRAVVRLVTGQTFAEMGPERTWLHLAPTWFDASTLEIWAPLLNGGRCVVAPDSALEVGALARAIKEHGVDSLWLTSSLFNAVVDLDASALSPLRQLLIGGEALSPAHVRRMRAACPSVRLVNGYGPTENTTFSTCHEITDADLDGRPIPIGRPIAGTHVHVLDVDGQPAPVGVAGELCAAGSGLALGYLGRPEATREKFVPDPFEPGALMYRTGDLVRQRPDGVLEFLGRLDRQIKVRGVRIEPGEIEAALKDQEGVADAVVVARAHPVRGTELLAYVVPAKGAPAPVEDRLRAALAARLPKAFLPARILPLDRLPLTPTGKIDLERLPAVEERAPSSVGPNPSDVPTPTETRVLALWCEVLGREGIARDDDFFALGGTSLAALRLVVRLEKEYDRPVPLSAILRARTVRTLAREIEGVSASSLPSAVISFRQVEGSIPLFCLPGVGGHVFSYTTLLDHLPPRRTVYGFQVQEVSSSLAAFENIQLLATELVRQMRHVRPRGPYYLLGYSFGGVVAFEMARQLEEAGETGGILVVIDAYPPSGIRQKVGLEKLAVHWRELSRRSPKEMWRYLAERVRRRLPGRRGPKNPSDAAEWQASVRIAEVTQACRRAFARYVPRPYSGDLTMIRALRMYEWYEVEPTARDCGWAPFIRGRVTVHELDCEHHEVFRPPYVDEVARRIDEVCAAREREERTSASTRTPSV
jgi:amino acid adenylation domain-containing protein